MNDADGYGPYKKTEPDLVNDELAAMRYCWKILRRLSDLASRRRVLGWLGAKAEQLRDEKEGR